MTLTRLFILSFILMLLANGLAAQFHISGFVSDRQTGERLIEASLVDCGTTKGKSGNKVKSSLKQKIKNYFNYEY